MPRQEVKKKGESLELVSFHGYLLDSLSPVFLGQADPLAQT